MARLARSAVVLCLVASFAIGCFADASVDNGINTGHGAVTDSDVVGRERKLRDGAQKFEFQAEVNRLMDILINSLYSNKDIFLRELISNASDALDKIRFLALTDKSVLGSGDAADLEIKISVDKERRALIIRDKGVGMTKDELIKNLGTIAKSGTSAFLEQMQKGGDVNLIGQFGVGFYSVYLVADYIEVVTKHNDDKQYVWESSADGNFAISEDAGGEPLGRGTEIRIYVKEEAGEYLEEAKLKELVSRYSEFINFPIYLWGSKEVDVEVPGVDDEGDEEEVEGGEDGADKDDDDVDVEDEEEDDDDESEDGTGGKTTKETVWDWELLNENKAIWLRPASDVTEEEYNSFYKAVGKAYDDPISKVHFRGEGDVEFTAILYLPKTAPFDMYDSYYSRKPQVKLYVRRVFITDEMEDFLPKYLSFLVGLVDSDSLPLNVNREVLQQHASLKTIKKKIVRKALDMIKRLADAEKRKRAMDAGELDEEIEEADKTALLEDADRYLTFWKEFGKALKLGIIEDTTNRNRLAKLIRFHTSKSGDAMTDLEEYVGRMKEGQKHIYYLTGSSKEELAASPFLEKLQEQGYEVVYFTDALDEYMMNSLKEYEDREFMNASKEDLKIGKRDKKQAKAAREAYRAFNKWWAGAIGDANVDVKVSHRLSKTPCVVVTSKYGWSANMERIMRAQALSDPDKSSYMKAKRFLEVNPRHAVVRALKAAFEADPEDAGAKDLAALMYDTALLESGFSIEDTKGFNGRVHALLKARLGIEPGADDILEEEEFPDAPAGSADDDDDAPPGGMGGMEGMEGLDMEGLEGMMDGMDDKDEL